MQEYHQLVRDVCAYLELRQTKPPTAVTTQPTPTAPPRACQPEPRRAPVPKTPPKKSIEPDASDLKAIIQRVAPQFSFRKQAVDDRRAREVALAWASRIKREPVAIVCDREKPPVEEMLQRLRAAVSAQLAPARLIEAQFWTQHHLWSALLASPTLRLIVAPIDLVKSHPELRAKVPILQTAPWSVLSKTPEAKRELWATLQTTLNSNG